MQLVKSKTPLIDTIVEKVEVGTPMGDYALILKGKRDAAMTLLSGDAYVVSKDQKKKLQQHVIDIDQIAKIINLGFEPTSPPDWYFGVYDCKVSGDFSENNATVRWPGKLRDGGAYDHYISYRVFTSPVPKAAHERYMVARNVLGLEPWQFRVYSPNLEDFKSIPAPQPKDPVIIFRVMLSGKPQYFEVARWNFAQDLAALYASL